MSDDPGEKRGARLNTWESILERLRSLGERQDEEGRIGILVELLVHLRLLGQDPQIPDLRTAKGDVEVLYAAIEDATRKSLDAVRSPSDRFIYYAREVIKKLPVRQGAEETIERIRAEAEAFEEGRTEDDPLRGFAGDLRKEVHRRLSPRIISAFLEPYLALTKRGDPGPIMAAGYVALPSRFSFEDESQEFVDLAEDLLERLRYLWDYESGDLASVRRQLAGNLELFERCFLKAEVEGFLALLTPENLSRPHVMLDLLKRLASFKHFLKESYFESRIALYDLLLLDLSIGRLIFLLANDLTNNHYAEVSPRNARQALLVIHELLNISSVKGLAIRNADRLRAELDEIASATAYDFLRTKRCLLAISAELQRYLQNDVIDAMSGPLNKAMEAYELPTAKLAQVRTRFFNNFIRRTQIHVLSEFVEKVASAVDKELERQRDERQLYADSAASPGGMGPLEPKSLVASTWGPLDERARPFLGGKGNSVVDMAHLGLSVPPAFVIGYPLLSRRGPSGGFAPDVEALFTSHLAELERRTGRRLGDPAHPLLVSVRSGAPTSMPGVMATIMNVGLLPAVREALARRRGAALVEAVYRRFLENCLGALAMLPGREQAIWPRDLPLPELESRVVEAFGPAFLADPVVQLRACVQLVYDSRGSSAVKAYSKTMAADIRAETAVTVQRIVFGNLSARSSSGVLITRNPITGADELFGEFKRRAQGEEVVMGSADTEPMAAMDSETAKELSWCKELLVRHYRQDLDIEFTVEDGTLYLLQARAARLGAFAQLVADTDFLAKGYIGLAQYRERLDRLESAYASLALPRADFRARLWTPPLAMGVPITGGVVSGSLVLSPDRLHEAERRRETVVYFAHTTKPTDFAIMNGAHAIVTVYPGRTSHAAITALAMNKTCIVGCEGLEIDVEARRVHFRGKEEVILAEGERVTVDGNTGAVYRGLAPISEVFLPVSEVIEAVAGAKTAGEAAALVRRLIETKMAGVRRETSLRRSGIEDLGDLSGERVLVRVDANIDQGEEAQPDGSREMPRELPRWEEVASRRIDQAAEVIRLLLDAGATPIVCSHLGDPGASPEDRRFRETVYRSFSLEPFAEALSSRLGGRVFFHRLSVGASGLLLKKTAIVPGVANVLENLRFAAGEKDNDEAFARSLAELSDGWFVNDAFNVCLRRHASITGVPKFVRHRAAGPLVVRELAALETLVERTPRPFVAVFTGEVEAQFGTMAALLARVDRLFLLPRRRGEAVEAAMVALRGAHPDKVTAAWIWDGAVAGNEEALHQLARDLGRAKALLWAGPAHLEALSALVRSSADAEGAAAAPLARIPPLEAALGEAIGKAELTVICSETEKQYAGLGGPRLHISSGPRAFLEYLERLSLPGITALDPARA